MCQAYNRTPSELYGIQGAAGLCLDTGIYLFARWVENEMQEAEQSASNSTFANMYRARAFARCMGDDMEKSNAGFRDPFADGTPEVNVVDKQGNRKRRVPFAEEEPGDELIDLADITVTDPVV